MKKLTFICLIASNLIGASAFAASSDDYNPFNPSGVSNGAVSSNISTTPIISKPTVLKEVDDSEVIERFDVVRIGTVNGQHLFRAKDGATYLSESVKMHKLSRVPVNLNAKSSIKEDSASLGGLALPPATTASPSFPISNLRGLSTGYSQGINPQMPRPPLTPAPRTNGSAAPASSAVAPK